MTDFPKPTVHIQAASETLLEFSVDRNDLKIILDSLPEGETIDRVKVEYEIQILKILSVGWSLSYFLEDSPLKQALTESFWLATQEFSATISRASSVSLSQDFDYFSELKDRLEIYIRTLDSQPDVKDPASLIGPKFAEVCSDADNVFIILSGSKMFNLAVLGVRHYLDSIELTLENPDQNASEAPLDA